MSLRRNLILLMLLASPMSAFAYVDPGSGMLIWQGVLAALGAVIVAVRKPTEIIKRAWRRLRGKQ
jgi:hypothetical protein